ncbi:MAG: recombination protein RecR [Nitrospirae bacterium]|nr:MAG: recombination protein RecR [Nitrospirota bacterium]
MSEPIENLIEQLTKLPGIGRKTAQRLAFFIVNMSKEDALPIAQAIIDVKEKVHFCRECFSLTDDTLCRFCKDPSRDRSQICVVEEPSNIHVIERTNIYRGLYHVLLGALSPVDGITPDKLTLSELKERVQRLGVKEVIVATNPNTKGELTAQYIKKMFEGMPVRVTRIAYGLPVGGDIEFADEVTLQRSLQGRISF